MPSFAFIVLKVNNFLDNMKRKMVNIFYFIDQIISIKTTHLYYCSVKVTTDNTYTNRYDGAPKQDSCING